MPIKPENRALYSKHWRVISAYIRFYVAGNRCQLCGAKNYQPHPITGSKVILTLMHLDHQPRNNIMGNLKAGCQRCHNRYDAAHRRITRTGQKDMFGC